MDLKFLAGPLKDIFVCICIATFLLSSISVLVTEWKEDKDLNLIMEMYIIQWLDPGYTCLVFSVMNRFYFYHLRTLFQVNSEKVLYMDFVLMLETLFIWLLST